MEALLAKLAPWLAVALTSLLAGWAVWWGRRRAADASAAVAAKLTADQRRVAAEQDAAEARQLTSAAQVQAAQQAQAAQLARNAATAAEVEDDDLAAAASEALAAAYGDQPSTRAVTAPDLASILAADVQAGPGVPGGGADR